MNIDFMRVIDKWLGIPICFALSAIDMIMPKNRIRTPKNILFIEMSEMGSSILAYPAIQKIKSMYPKANIYFLIFRKNRKSVDILGTIKKSNVLTVSSESLFSLMKDTLSIILKLRRLNIDITFDLELFSRYTSIITYLSAAKSRVGFYQYHQEGLYRGSYLTHKVLYNPHQHMVFNFLAQVHSVSRKRHMPLLKENLQTSDLQLPKISFNTPALRQRLSNMAPELKQSSRIVILNPNAGLLPIRAWPLENYISLAKRILNKYEDTYIIITGVGGASKDAANICKALDNKKVLDLTNKTAFEELIDLFNIAKVLITNDSGPAHFASLTQVKSMVFFGPETPKLYGPLGKNCTPIFAGFACSPCVSAFNHRKTPCKDNRCLKSITVEQVFEIFSRILKE